jgi:glycosyltransferase involved in cell wall biosynthesis
MNIAYVSADFGVPIFGTKGASIHVGELVAALRKAGHSICVISPAIEEGEEKSAGMRGGRHAQGVAFLAIPPSERHLRLFKELNGVDEFLGTETRIRQELRNLLYNLTLYKKALKYLRQRRPDLIYERYALFGYAGIRLARKLGVPHILEVNAPLAYEQEKMRGLEMKDLAQETERQILHETDKAIVVSRQLQEWVVSCGVPDTHIHVLPNAVDPCRFAAARNGDAVRARYQLDGKRVIGFAGSLKSWHGTETLLEAFRALHATEKKTRLLIVGDGPGREDLESRAQASGLSGMISFTGNVPYDDIPDYLAAMDITVAPYTPNDNFYYSPIKIFEYMAMGKQRRRSRNLRVIRNFAAELAKWVKHGYRRSGRGTTMPGK